MWFLQRTIYCTNIAQNYFDVEYFCRWNKIIRRIASKFCKSWLSDLLREVSHWRQVTNPRDHTIDGYHKVQNASQLQWGLRRYSRRTWQAWSWESWSRRKVSSYMRSNFHRGTSCRMFKATSVFARNKIKVFTNDRMHRIKIFIIECGENEIPSLSSLNELNEC